MPQFTQFETELFVPQPSGEESERCWTLATRLGDMLRIAEERFGPRDLSYTFLGIEFAGTQPMIWYPGDGKHIIIQLTLDALTDFPRACYQLGHESIHLLAPTGRRDATNLEEGLATLFGENYATKWFNAPRNCGGASYESVKEATKNALAKNPNFIRDIRRSKPSFCDFTPRDIKNSVDISLAEAKFLCGTFYTE